MNRAVDAVWLGVKSLTATILFPGTLAGFVPWRYYGVSSVAITGSPVQMVGLLVLAVGLSILFICIWEFARKGRGTLAPVDPPKHLVTTGLYRYSRNPMYLGVLTTLLGELALAWSVPFLEYVGLFFVLVNIWIFIYEEPTLRRLFGQEYDEYCRRVGRWIPRLTTER